MTAPVQQDYNIAIETSGRHGSVALGRGPDLIAEESFPAQAEHGRDLLPTLDGLCRRNNCRPDQIGQCYVSIGPGSFTGLRVAVACARALALARGVRICAVPTLEVIAMNCAELASPPGRLAVILDAKRNQVFGAIFELTGEKLYRCITEPAVIEPGRLLQGGVRPEAVTGEGIDYHEQAVQASCVAVVDRSHWTPRAAGVYRLGWGIAQQGAFTAPRDLVPHYLRRPEAEELWEKRRAGA